jgi:hypothetical protein
VNAKGYSFHYDQPFRGGEDCTAIASHGLFEAYARAGILGSRSGRLAVHSEAIFHTCIETEALQLFFLDLRNRPFYQHDQ